MSAELRDSRRSGQVLSALDRASAAMAEATSEQATYTAAARTLSELGFSTTVLTFDDHAHLRLRYLHADEGLIRTAEKLAGMHRSDFKIRADATSFHIRVVHERQTVYCADAVEIAKEVLPTVPAAVTRAICRMMGVTRMIGSPLIVGDEVIGLVVVSSTELLPDDVAVVKLFARQLSGALSKARLLEDLQLSVQELRETQDQLLHAQKIEAIGLLASGVAHDFNNLLSAISMSAKLVGHALEDDDAHSDLRVIHDACARGSALVAQLMAMANREEMKVGPCDIDALLRDLQRLFQRVLGEDVRVDLAFEPGSKWVIGDRHMLEQVLVNLATNARDAMRNGGVLHISTSAETIDVSTTELSPGDYVRIRVRDDGDGMPRDTIGRVFEPFYTTKGPGKGTGLGLSAAKAVLGRHGGDICVERSEIGEGTTFSMLLPRCDAPSVTEATEELGRTPTGHGELVLVVEDEPLVQRSTERVLRRAGYRVVCALDAATARDLVNRHGDEIALILCDCVLPDARGPELVVELKESVPNVGVILASGYMDERVNRSMMDDHDWHFLAKPFATEELLRIAGDLLVASAECAP